MASRKIHFEPPEWEMKPREIVAWRGDTWMAENDDEK